MEMQQVRYFLAVSRTLNFTRAAEECNVTQPALTRAIKQLEDELGGELIRREGRNSHLTDLGNRMRPLLQQCYDSAIAAKQVASKLKKGEVAALSLVVSRTFDLDLLTGPLAEVQRSFPALQLKIRRASGSDICELLKTGDVDLAVAGALGDEWDRLDAWPMFTESFDIVGDGGPIDLTVEVFRDRRFLDFAGADDGDCPRCELAAAGVAVDDAHRLDSLRDLEAFAAAGLGAAVIPASTLRRSRLRRAPCPFNAERTVTVYSVAGRQRSKETAALLNLLRATDWEAKLSEDLCDAA
nr:LysR family transcriptional regulator [Sphingomonas sp.]